MRVEQTARPTACAWLPSAPPASEPCVVTANDGYKLRLLSAEGLTLSRTVLGPTYGGPLTKMLLLPAPAAAATATGDDDDGSPKPSKERYVAYATAEKVVGLMKLPLDGNPSKAMGLIAHPGELSGLTASHDGKWLITTGGDDLAIHLWQVDVGALEATVDAGGEGLAPYEALLDGGKGGAFYEEMRDYFYYAQLRAQGEDTTEPRRITGRVPVSEIANLMRAFGYYPSEREIDELVLEVRLANTKEGGGAAAADSVDFGTLLRLYVNHRPVLGPSKEQIGGALGALAGGAASSISREALLRALQANGEALTPDDLAQCLRALVGTADAGAVLPTQLDGQSFAEGVLGFEDYDGEQQPAE